MTEPLSGPSGTARDSAGAVASTAKDEALRVTDEVRTQTKNLAADARDRLAREARTQNDRLAEGLRHMAEELDRMAGDRPDSPARSIVSRIARSGEQAADYLSKHGPEEVLDEIQEFARRRPGAFLATAAIGGFLVGRIGKSVLGAESSRDGRIPDRRMPERSAVPATEIYDTADLDRTAPVVPAPADPTMRLWEEPADDRY